jgi:hypothetical protein
MTYTNKGDRLQQGQTLAANEYLQAGNAMYYLMMQDNGDLCVFHGSGPEDNHPPLLWYSQTSDNAGGHAFLAMQGDGNLCLYRGDSGSQGGWLWGLNDGLARHPLGDAANQGSVAIMQGDGNFVVYSPQGVMWATDNPPAITGANATVVYDMNGMSTSDSIDPDMIPLSLTNENDSGVTQTQTLNFSEGYSKTSSWSTTESITIGVSMTFSLVPVLNAGSVTVSASATHSYTSGGSVTSTDTISAIIPVTAPPHTTVTGTGVLRKRTFIIPYSGTAVYSYSDGASVTGAISGHYVGTSYFLYTQTV